MTSARVTHLDIEGNKVSAVHVNFGATKYSVSAPMVIVSAGGIGTPPILRSAGIINAGQEFFFDPLVVTVGLLSNLDDGREFPMATGM
jgi:choline dehydrogenase-like flavoprotein